MSEWLGLTVGIVFGGVLLSALGALALFVPVVSLRGLQVLVSREWVPVAYSVRSLMRRRAMALTAVLLVALVVFTLTAGGMLAMGVERTLTSTAESDSVKILKNPALPEFASWLSFPQMDVLQGASAVMRDSGGSPLVSGEMVVLFSAQRSNVEQRSSEEANLAIRGVDPVAFVVHDMTLLRGRRFAPGKSEIIIGKALAGVFEGAVLGGSMHFAKRSWEVVGVADFGGSAYNSEIWGDIATLAPAFKTGYSTATAKLREPKGLTQLAAELRANPVTNDLVVKREIDYWKSLSGNSVGFVMILGSAVGLIFAVGAILGALNVMFAMVSARIRELGTLRAIGFKPRAILVAVLGESVGLAFVGGLLGVLAASTLGGVKFALTTNETLREITYELASSGVLNAAGVSIAIVVGYAGGLWAALRAAGTPIVSAVRAE